MRCQKCGTENDGKFCQNCGAPMNAAAPEAVAYDPTAGEASRAKRKHGTLAVIGFIISISSLLLRFVPVLGFIVCAAGFVLCLVAVCTAKKKDRKKSLAISGLVITSFLLVTFPFVSKDNSHEASASSDAALHETAEPTEKPLSREEFIASCTEIPYKDIMRNPSDYEGMPICVTLRISQVMDASFFSDAKWYHCYSSNSDYGYYDDEYYVTDDRSEADPKLLEDDVIKIYGTVSGTESVTRAINGTTAEIVKISMMYCDLVGE